MSETTVKTGHPKGLWVLFGTEMWERFNFYGMRAILTLFMVNSLLIKEADAAIIYGGFLALCYLTPLLEGFDIGLLSESGCPAVADPGSKMVALAHQKNIRVIPMTGPSSIILALMASGLNGQQFKFHGYLPSEKEDRIKKIISIENLKM